MASPEELPGIIKMLPKYSCIRATNTDNNMHWIVLSKHALTDQDVRFVSCMNIEHCYIYNYCVVSDEAASYYRLLGHNVEWGYPEYN